MRRRALTLPDVGVAILLLALGVEAVGERDSPRFVIASEQVHCIHAHTTCEQGAHETDRHAARSVFAAVGGGAPRCG
jgi:hypothetical protein